MLRGSTTTSFLTSAGPRSLAPAGVRYVVTLDADTRLPRGVIGRLVGTIAHPLNRPSFDARLGRVDGRLRTAPAAHHADTARARGRVDLPEGVRRFGRHRPVRHSGVGRLPRPVRGGQLHRQGDLRRRCVRIGDARSSAGERDAQPRPVRRCLRTGRPGDRRRTVRRVPVGLPGGRRASASLGPR